MRRLKKNGDRYIAQYIHVINVNDPMVRGKDFEIRTHQVTINFLRALFTEYAMKLISECENLDPDSWLVVHNPSYHQSIRNNLTYKQITLKPCHSYYELSGYLPADWGLKNLYIIPFDNPFDELHKSTTSQRLSNDKELQEKVDNNAGKRIEITAGFTFNNGASDPGYEYANPLVPVPTFACQDPHDNDDYNCFAKAFGAGLSLLPQYDAESLTKQLLSIPVGDEATYVKDVQQVIKSFQIKLKNEYHKDRSIKKLLTEIFTQKQDSKNVVTLLKVNAGGNLHTVSVSPKGYMFEVTLEHALKPTMENLELICDCGVHVLKAWVFTTAGKGKKKKKNDQI